MSKKLIIIMGVIFLLVIGLAITILVEKDKLVVELRVKSVDTIFLNVPLGEFIITVKGFSKPITMPLTITSDQEIKLEISVD